MQQTMNSILLKFNRFYFYNFISKWTTICIWPNFKFNPSGSAQNSTVKFNKCLHNRYAGHRKCNFPTKSDVKTAAKARSKVYNIFVEKRCDKNSIDLEHDNDFTVYYKCSRLRLIMKWIFFCLNFCTSVFKCYLVVNEFDASTEWPKKMERNESVTVEMRAIGQMRMHWSILFYFIYISVLMVIFFTVSYTLLSGYRRFVCMLAHHMAMLVTLRLSLMNVWALHSVSVCINEEREREKK